MVQPFVCGINHIYVRSTPWEKVDFAGDAAESMQQPQNTVTKPREQSQSAPQRSEVPVVVGFYQLRKRFKLDHLMIICAVFCTLRAFATAFATTPTMLIWVQGLEILGFSIYYAGSVFYVMDNLPAQDCVKGASCV